MPSASTSVLLVEDEESFIDALTAGLTREGFAVRVARDGAQALEQFDDMMPDVVVLDVALPLASGFDVCRELRSRSEVPIVLVSAQGTEIDVVLGLEAGADDCIARPDRMRELVARLRAVLRRSRSVRLPARDAASRPEPSEHRPFRALSRRATVAGARRVGRVAPGEPEVVEVGDVTVDLSRHEVTVRGSQVQLPLKEFELLVCLLRSAGRVVTREVLMDRIWGPGHSGDSKTLDVHIKRLRAKVETDPASPERIVTIRGLGYKYELPHRRP